MFHDRGPQSPTLNVLSRRAIDLGAVLGRLNREAESVLRFGIHATNPLDPAQVSVETFLAALPTGADRASFRHILPEWQLREKKAAFDERLDQYRLRLGRLLLRAWSEIATTTARRPDIGQLLCVGLSSPESPLTYEVARFVIVMVLRSRYRIPYTTTSLRKLSDAYEHLTFTFRHQQRRRQSKTDEYESFLVDLLCLQGWAVRAASPGNLLKYYEDFGKYALGVADDGLRETLQPAPELFLTAQMPDFATLVNIAFAQPTLVPGLDDVIGGLIACIPDSANSALPGGLVTLVAGPPGSGKTSFCLTLAERMAELGSEVRYISTEEPVRALEAKRITMARRGAESLWLSLAPEGTGVAGAFEVLYKTELVDFAELAEGIRRPFAGMDLVAVGTPQDDKMYLVFPRVVVIDSVTALLNPVRGMELDNDLPDLVRKQTRRHLGVVLGQLRDLGVYVILVGGLEDCSDNGLAYLVDNVFTLEQQPRGPGGTHLMRTFSVMKTRLQVSYRGQHVLHLSRVRGVTVSPSLDAVLRTISHPRRTAHRERRAAVLWTAEAHRQRALPFDGPEADSVLISEGAHVLVYGQGAAGKAALAMRMAFEPRVRYGYYAGRRGNADLGDDEVRWLARARILVISFLYAAEYYEEIAASVLRDRYRKNRSIPALLTRHLAVSHFYAGYIDADTLVGRVRNQLQVARLEGSPYTGVVVDGVQNILMQFPLLEADRLLWSVLFRLFWAESIETVSTFTFFKRDSISTATSEGAWGRLQAPGAPMLGEEALFHLLVSSCDHVFVVERPASGGGTDGDAKVRIRLVSSPRHRSQLVPEVGWDPVRTRFVLQ